MGRAALLALVGAAALACAGTRQPRAEAASSGFLGDYSMLAPGKEGEAQLVYANPNADFSRYRAVMIDSVTLWRGKTDSHLSKLSREDQQMLADRLYKALHTALAKEWAIVENPAPGVLRVRAALTDAKGSNVPLDVVTTVIPQVRLLATAGGLGADTAVTVGKVTAEAEVTDSLTGERLLAGVDARVGTRGLEGVTNKWSDVQMAFDDWGERLRARLGGTAKSNEGAVESR
jgi:hypothetical protein